MNEILIPTPQQLTRRSGIGRTWQRGSVCRLAVAGKDDDRGEFAVRFLADRLRRQFGLRVRVEPFSSSRTDSDIDFILCSNGDLGVARRLPPKFAALDGLANEQGYVIVNNGSDPAILHAHTPTGLLYAGATLLQLLTRTGSSIRLPNVTVKDWPQFRWRGNSWLLRAELEGWSYARGDGLRAYEERVIRKLDLCAFHKINFLHFDGFTWDVGSFPGHVATMLRLNHAARLRGIRLSFGGYGACGDGMENRHRYPDGPTYACIGQRDHPERFNGTCLSNQTLTRMRQARMETFVRRVQPGAIYLHGIDTGKIADSTPIWMNRCPACRKRWPNDEIAEPDGMAGAYAAFYDAMAKAIHDVDPDCLLTVVSPCYTGMEESDAEWDKAVVYWLSVSRCLRDRTIQIGLREQFAGASGRQPRFVSLGKRLDREANGHRISCIHFFGGDCFYNSHPFLATPMLSHYFDGADLVVNGNGHAYQEPQALFNAECLWNPRTSWYFSPATPEPFAKLYRRYLRLSYAENRPRRIFGPNGFLDDACVRLYGRKAGPLAAQIYRLAGKAEFRWRDNARFNHPPVMMPIFNYLHPARKGFRHAGIVWKKKLKPGPMARRLVAVYREVAKLNRQAIVLARRAARLCADRHVAADLIWMADTLEAGRLCAETLGPFVEFFLRMHAIASKGGDNKRALAEISQFNNRLDTFDCAMKRTLPRRLLPDEIEMIARRDMTDKLRQILAEMKQTFAKGTWPS